MAGIKEERVGIVADPTEGEPGQKNTGVEPGRRGWPDSCVDRPLAPGRSAGRPVVPVEGRCRCSPRDGVARRDGPGAMRTRRVSARETSFWCS